MESTLLFVVITNAAVDNWNLAGKRCTVKGDSAVLTVNECRGMHYHIITTALRLALYYIDETEQLDAVRPRKRGLSQFRVAISHHNVINITCDGLHAL